MGKSKGRVPIKGGSKKVRQIKNVQEGGRDIGSDKDIDIKMTNLLHFFKDIVDNKGDIPEGNDLQKNLPKLFYLLGGNKDIILLRNGGTLDISEEAVAGEISAAPRGDAGERAKNPVDFDDKAKAYAEGLSNLGFTMQKNELTPQRGRLETPEVETGVEINALPDDDDIEFAIPEGDKITLTISKYTIEPVPSGDAENKIIISNELYKLLGIPGDYNEVKDGGVDIHIFNEYRLPMLHHILNLRIFLANKSDDNKLLGFFVKDDKLSKICKISLKTGRFLNATGYHIKEDQKLTRFDVGSFEINGNTIVNNPPATMDQFLNLFNPIGKTSRDREDVERASRLAKATPP